MLKYNEFMDAEAPVRAVHGRSKRTRDPEVYDVELDVEELDNYDVTDFRLLTVRNS